jgi:hypothetical protein
MIDISGQYFWKLCIAKVYEVGMEWLFISECGLLPAELELCYVSARVPV